MSRTVDTLPSFEKSTAGARAQSLSGFMKRSRKSSGGIAPAKHASLDDIGSFHDGYLESSGHRGFEDERGQEHGPNPHAVISLLPE